MFPSESDLTYLSNPWLMTSQETVWSICKSFILISIQYLPYRRVTCTSSAGPITVLSRIIAIGWHPFASSCTRVLVYSVQIVVILQISCYVACSVTKACPTETVIRNPASLETSPILQQKDGRGSHHAHALLQPNQGTWCSHIVLSLHLLHMVVPDRYSVVNY